MFPIKKKKIGYVGRNIKSDLFWNKRNQTVKKEIVNLDSITFQQKSHENFD